jgi:hypothetical protein
MPCDLSPFLSLPLSPEIQRPHGYLILLAKFSPPQPAGLKCFDQLLHFCTASPLLNSFNRLFFFSHPFTSTQLMHGK